MYQLFHLLLCLGLLHFTFQLSIRSFSVNIGRYYRYLSFEASRLMMSTLVELNFRRERERKKKGEQNVRVKGEMRISFLITLDQKKIEED